jgi:hypothetical protein
VRNVLAMDGRSSSDSAWERLGAGAVCACRARWSPKKWRGGGGDYGGGLGGAPAMVYRPCKSVRLGGGTRHLGGSRNEGGGCASRREPQPGGEHRVVTTDEVAGREEMRRQEKNGRVRTRSR